MKNMEMLELAAKAAGYLTRSDNLNVWLIEENGSPLCAWNPIENKSQALDLLIDCDLTLCTDGSKSVSVCEEYLGKNGVFITQMVGDCKDKKAAVCLAIVRAASEIGKKK